MVVLNKSAFLSSVMSAVDRAQDYLVNLGHSFEVCLLVSGYGVAGLQQYGLGDGGFHVDCTHDDYHMHGFRILFTDASTIPSLVSHSDGVIEPVVICHNYSFFPSYAPVGTYIYCGGRMVQVIDCGYDEYGATSYGIRDVRIRVIGHALDEYIDYYIDPLTIALRDVNKRNQERDRWALEPDTTAIDEYLSSLTII